ncbi:MAG: glycoside hydrolase family 5 protein, partial [Defluviitaleaceae bacterium]|nr:glycoside hydrolase family 5 protein [Defluviitaleaceae bacterium]
MPDHLKYYGFNFLWMFARYRPEMLPQPPALTELDFLAKHGFNFVRVPMDYRFWTRGFDYLNPDERVFEEFIDRYLEECTKRGLHMCLNIHRAPGYCINGNDLEKHNLWVDDEAQNAFQYLWELFAKRYKGIGNDRLSFDLLNEPPDIGQYGCDRVVHEKLMRRIIASIRAIDPTREIVLDGLEGGHTAIPELADAGVIHSGRGYTPFPVSHHGAEWIPSMDMPAPVYPGEMYGTYWNRDALVDFYQPWREVEKLGARVHIGEFGCYNKTPNDIALRWLTDLF